jgi:hypothetical protein
MMRRIELTAAERGQLSPDVLATLASCKRIELTRAERDRMTPDVLSQLAISGAATIDDDELARFSPVVRVIVEQNRRRE